jgi:hypothetical protein
MSEARVDPRLAFLLRLSVQFDLVEAGLVDLDEAVAAAVHACHMIAPCQCEREIAASIERHALLTRQRRLQAWRWRHS